MKAVLISEIPLPFHKMGSWTKRYTELIYCEENPFEFIICPKIDKSLTINSFSTYFNADRYNYERLLKYYYKYKYYFFLKKLKNILDKEEKLVIHIIDNVKLLNEVHHFLVAKRIRGKCKIIFNSCGFSYFFTSSEGVNFYDKIDHIIFSTNEAYQFELNRYSYISSRVSIIPNGIDSKRFHKLTNVEKLNEKHKIGFSDKKIVLWLSQDRKKKGLHILIEAWKNSRLMNNKDYVLVIIGTSKIGVENNINYLGKVKNTDLPSYYQSCDYYFFTSLVHEGFGLSLGEAIKCGTTCFASNILPMNEVVKKGKLGYLVNDPNKTSSWLNLLNEIGEDKITKIDIDKTQLDELYSLKSWKKNLSELVKKEKTN